MPLVVSTNDWLLGASDEQVAWLSANSVRIDVTEPMWVEDNLLAVTDGVADLEEGPDGRGRRASEALLEE